MILLAPSGATTSLSKSRDDTLCVGTTDGVFLLSRGAEGGWKIVHRALEGGFISSLARLADGALVAGIHGLGVAISRDGGRTWPLSNHGLTQPDVWVVHAGVLDGREMLFAGTLPARLFVSADGGANWRECEALTRTPSALQWMFPPPPHFAHVLDVTVHKNQLFVGIEVGALLRSRDGGESFEELPVSPEVAEVDIHKLIFHPDRPGRILAATGWGMIESHDDGVTWGPSGALPDIHYPVPFLCHPTQPDLLFVAGGRGWPPQWYERGRSEARIARSRDGGRNWERLLGGLPDGQRPLYSALALAAWDGGFDLYSVDTDGQLFESVDGGDSWRVVAETAPASKGEQYRGLAKGRAPLVATDDLLFTGSGKARIDALEA